MTGPSQSLREFVHETWQQNILPTLRRYITIPNQSPAFDKEWREHGYMDQAVDLLAAWVTAQNVPGLQLEVRREAGRTPLLFIEVAGDEPSTILLYGHLDKQPPMSGWREGLDPWTPALEDGKLFGRGAADDGYATFAAVTAIKALKRASIPSARCVIIIEACEESGSFDLPRHVSDVADRIGHPDLVICLDSGCGDYQRLWVTTSLRGIVNGALSVSTLTEGVHSGAASGIVPSTFRVLRILLTRLENEQTGEIMPREFYVDIPTDRLEQARRGAEVLGDTIHREYPFQPAVRPVHENGFELLLNRTWRPQLEVIAADGFPAWEQAGNVLRPLTRVKLSLRLPPTADTSTSVNCLRRLFSEDPPYGATVTFTCGQGSRGWNAPSFAPWLEAAINRASVEFFSKEACAIGEGGTIPFMAMLAEKFPQAQFMITGVLGPHSNAHGPNEFLHLGTAEKLTACVARVLEAHGQRT